MIKNYFAVKLNTLMQHANIKNATLAQAVQYDISYISKWLSGKTLPSDKNIDSVIAAITECLLEGNSEKFCQVYSCEEWAVRERIKEDMKKTYEDSRSREAQQSVTAVMSLPSLIKQLDDSMWESGHIFAVADIFAMNHEERLLLAGIKNGRFFHGVEDREYSMVLDVSNSQDCVYDSIFMVHMLTSLSGLHFKLYHHHQAYGKLIYITDGGAVTSLLVAGSCVGVGQFTEDGEKLKSEIKALAGQEHLIFREVTMEQMVQTHDYMQSMISTNIKWLLGHMTELLLPADVYEELLIQSGLGEIEEYKKLYAISRNIVEREQTQIMIYESAISDLVVLGIVDFYNIPLKLTRGQIVKCFDYLRKLAGDGDWSNIKVIAGGFSDDFKYITNPCMFLSDSLCYLRLENGRYEDNILILKDRTTKDLFFDFFEKVWSDRKDVVIEDGRHVRNKITHYKSTISAMEDI